MEKRLRSREAKLGEGGAAALPVFKSRSASCSPSLSASRRGQSPTITLGPYTGDQLSVDHVIPFSVHPELDHVIANLELMPLRLNIRKRDAMGQRQLDLLQRLRHAGLGF